jgi:hypothetical protein
MRRPFLLPKGDNLRTRVDKFGFVRSPPPLGPLAGIINRINGLGPWRHAGQPGMIPAQLVGSNQTEQEEKP